jgi:colanic acid/amylovoran biosynthesis glycosyltransferase
MDVALRRLISEHGLADKVELVGPAPQSETIKQIQQAALLAAPCVVGPDGNRDGLPTVLIEAMALGTPCVGTDVTGIPEIVQNDVTGLVVPQTDVAALADALKRLLHDSDLRVRLAEKARALVESQFEIHANAAKLRKVFVRSAEQDAREPSRA